MEWLIGGAILVVAVAALPFLLARSKSGKRKAGAGGAIMITGLIFMTIFDPAKAATVEEVRRRKDLGDADQGDCGEKKD